MDEPLNSTQKILTNCVLAVRCVERQQFGFKCEFQPNRVKEMSVEELESNQER